MYVVLVAVSLVLDEITSTLGEQPFFHGRRVKGVLG